MIIRRLKNAYKTGGVLEVFRKIFYHVVYSINGKYIFNNICKKKPEYALYEGKNREFNVIVSLTTYPKRFDSLELCLRSLTLQNEKPDKIIVYLGSDSVGVALPDKIKAYERFGLEFRIDAEHNFRSHKKYYYAMKEFPNAIVVTADDDIIYPENWLSSLLDSYKKYPNAISARRVHLIRRETDGTLKPYNCWIDQYRKLKVPNHALIATGNAGILYPPKCLDERVFDANTFCEICFEADDIWLKCMALLKGTKVVWVPNWEVDLPEVEVKGETGLANTNVWENQNDRFLENVIEKFGIKTIDFFSD